MSDIAQRTCLITRGGRRRLCGELAWLGTTRRLELAEALREARADGPEPENSGVAFALDQLAALERRISELEAIRSVVRIADPPVDGVAGIGQLVWIRMTGRAEPVDYHLVGSFECDTERRRISVDSPVGLALVGRRAGDAVEVVTPSGPRIVEIVAIGESR